MLSPKVSEYIQQVINTEDIAGSVLNSNVIQMIIHEMLMYQMYGMFSVTFTDYTNVHMLSSHWKSGLQLMFQFVDV